MRIGVLTVLLGSLPLEEALGFIKRQGVTTVEIGTGNYPGNAHCPLDELLESSVAFERWRDTFKRHGFDISGLSCHGNPVHPNTAFASENDRVFRQTVLLAEKLELHTVICFSGCPGIPGNTTTPVWPINAWPQEHRDALEQQWDEVLVPYWDDAARFAGDHGQNVALELHPKMSVYNPRTLRELRQRSRKNIGANFDPSHLFQQHIDPLLAIRSIGGEAIYHVHGKDMEFTPECLVNGVYDPRPFSEPNERSWNFRTIGYGHDELFWKQFTTTLRVVGYDGVISIEHEDPYLSPQQGLCRAVELLNRVVITDPAGEAYWS